MAGAARKVLLFSATCTARVIGGLRGSQEQVHQQVLWWHLSRCGCKSEDQVTSVQDVPTIDARFRLEPILVSRDTCQSKYCAHTLHGTRELTAHSSPASYRSVGVSTPRCRVVVNSECQLGQLPRPYTGPGYPEGMRHSEHFLPRQSDGLMTSPTAPALI